MKKTLVALLAGGLLAAAPAAPGLAAPNPAGTGQPGAECGARGATMEPPGFLTAGFAHAETVYAGSDGTPLPRARELPCGFSIRHRLLPGDVEPLEVCSRPGCVWEARLGHRSLEGARPGAAIGS